MSTRVGVWLDECCYCELFKRVGLPESGTGSCKKWAELGLRLLLVSLLTLGRIELPRAARYHHRTRSQTLQAVHEVQNTPRPLLLAADCTQNRRTAGLAPRAA